jgi:thiamine monophosphate synthase
MFINNKKIKYFYFGNNLENTVNLLKYKNISFIYIWDKKSTKEQVFTIKKFCKKNKIKFYISNNIYMANLVKADGIHLPSQKKTVTLNVNNMDIIGTVYSQNDYYIKKNQKCNAVFLSPLFYTNKYSNNKILGLVKFNLISKNWDIHLYALGGLRTNNLHKINLTKCSGIGGISFVEGLELN